MSGRYVIWRQGQENVEELAEPHILIRIKGITASLCLATNLRHRDQSARQDQVTLHVSSPTFHFYRGLDLSFMSSPYSVAMH